MRPDSRTLALIPRAVAVNVVVGQVVALVKLPVFLDSIGTVLVGCLAGPVAGALTGALSDILMGLISNPAWLPFFVVAALVGALSGLAGRLGVFRSLLGTILAGAVTGVVAAAVSAPIAAGVFGGVTGGGADLVVGLFRAQGLSAMQASFQQALLADPVDKVLTFLVVAWVLRCSPARLLDQFPGGLRALGSRLQAAGPGAETRR